MTAFYVSIMPDTEKLLERIADETGQSINNFMEAAIEDAAYRATKHHRMRDALEQFASTSPERDE